MCAGVSEAGTVLMHAWSYYTFTVPTPGCNLSVSLTPFWGDADLYTSSAGLVREWLLTTIMRLAAARCDIKHMLYTLAHICAFMPHELVHKLMLCTDCC